MNSGAFGENFPYTNFHDLNMDWIIKIAKDFLDQYTSIQQIITDGEASLTEKTEQGLQALEDKKTELENLLDQWYENHSEDIANALANALQEISTSYQTVITNFTNYANEKGQEVIDSIPADYTALVQRVSDLETGDYNIVNVSPFTNEFYYDYEGTIHQNSAPWKSTDLIPVNDFKSIVYHLYGANSLVAMITFFDKNGSLISENPHYMLPRQAGWYDSYCAIPTNASYFRATTQTAMQGTPTVTLYKDKIPVDLTSAKASGNTTLYYYDGRTFESSPTGKFKETYYIPVSDFNIISYTGMGFHSDEIRLETVTFFDGELNRISGIFPAMSPNTYSMFSGTYPIPTNAKWVKLFYNTDYDTESISLIKRNKNTHIICIGDSITQGQGATAPYPDIMADELGNEFTVFNAGVGGSNTATYWTNYKDMLRLPTADCIIFMFGLNGGMTDTFDTDVDPYNNYNDYANTITGCTCKFIEWIMENRPDCMIMYATPSYAKDATHEAQAELQIENLPTIQQMYNIPIADIRNMMGINGKNYSNFLQVDNVHGNQKMYTKLGKAMADSVRSFINTP